MYLDEVAVILTLSRSDTISPVLIIMSFRWHIAHAFLHLKFLFKCWTKRTLMKVSASIVDTNEWIEIGPESTIDPRWARRSLHGRGRFCFLEQAPLLLQREFSFFGQRQSCSKRAIYPESEAGLHCLLIFDTHSHTWRPLNSNTNRHIAGIVCAFLSTFRWTCSDSSLEF